MEQNKSNFAIPAEQRQKWYSIAMPQETSGEETAAGDAPEEKQQILAHLREAFDACELNGIEQGLSRFARAHLTAEERELLTELHAAYENLDYEEGSELLSGRML